MSLLHLIIVVLGYLIASIDYGSSLCEYDGVDGLGEFTILN